MAILHMNNHYSYFTLYRTQVQKYCNTSYNCPSYIILIDKVGLNIEHFIYDGKYLLTTKNTEFLIIVGMK